jgi:uroporphyrin-III C-methyltransferase
MNTKVTLVGAGPGDPELLTLKAINAIKNADAILYDALINKAVLKYAKPSAKLMCVGKRVGRHSFKQEEINKLIIDHAFNYGDVVRLKGGDPFIFGRGYEELEYVESFGIKVEVISGISSSTAVPAFQKIPVTHRGVSHSYWVLTATNKEGELSADIKLAVQTNATVVILMGVNKLKEIVKLYKKQDKENVPIALIQNGTLKSEKAIYGTIETIEQLKNKATIQAPAIIIIGEVVALKQRILVDELSSLNYYEN